MNLMRSLLFDNLGLKLVALLLAMGVYFNAFTDRASKMTVAFPIQIADISDSLALLGPPPHEVTVELRGTGKQLIRLRVTEPPIRISLAGVSAGHFERALGPEDLPLPPGVEIDRFVSPRTLDLEVDRKMRRSVPVAPSVEGEPASGAVWSGWTRSTPATVEVSGPERTVIAVDSVRLTPVTIAGRRDTVTSMVGPRELAEGLTVKPDRIEVTVPLEAGLTRRVPLEIQPPRNAGEFTVRPARATLIVSGPRRSLSTDALEGLAITWTVPPAPAEHIGRRVGLRRVGKVPQGVRARLEPDSATLVRGRP